MSSRATIKRVDRVVPFVWTPAGGGPPPLPPGVSPAFAPAPRLLEPPAAPAPAPPPAPDPAEQSARLAALERDAFAKGYAQGERAGVEAGTRRSEAMLRRLGETLDEIASLRQQILQQSERQVVQLALALARRIVRREVEADQEFLAALARVALDRLGESGPATIHLHPDDFGNTAARHVEEWAKAHIKVVADPAVSRGGCVVESPFGFVDASIDAQFQELARALLDTEAPGLECLP